MSDETKILLTALLTVAALGSVVAGAYAGQSNAKKTFNVTLLQGVRGDEFYVSMACGAQAAAKAIGGVGTTGGGGHDRDAPGWFYPRNAAELSRHRAERVAATNGVR